VFGDGWFYSKHEPEHSKWAVSYKKQALLLYCLKIKTHAIQLHMSALGEPAPTLGPMKDKPSDHLKVDEDSGVKSS
jgi:hypothetical protein